VATKTFSSRRVSKGINDGSINMRVNSVKTEIFYEPQKKTAK
jgi:hypothetical protein